MALPMATINALISSAVSDVVSDTLGDPAATAAVDAELLTKVLAHLSAYPDEWDQRNWAQRTPCGTTACLAGTTVQLAGHDFQWDTHETIALRLTDGRAVDEVAQDLLGLSDGAALYLFYCWTDDIGELWRRAAQVTGGRVAVPPEFAA